MIESQLFTVIVYTENSVSLLNQVSIVFTRRGLNIESISAGPSSIEGVHKYTITCRGERSLLEKVITQIEKRIDVIRAYLFTDNDVVYQEVALYKVSTESLVDEPNLEGILRRHNANILEITRDYTVVEKMGHSDETQALLEALQPFGILQFTRSGRVAVTKGSEERLTNYLIDREALRQERIEDGRADLS
ncbi:MAG: acetolactate synthase small subunit [Bacteroidales bacterium]|nr:acetolactate synthase small subunit [Bacteroidales bacterium]